MKKAFKLMALALVAGAIMVSCKKPDPTPGPTPDPEPDPSENWPVEAVLLDENFDADTLLPAGWTTLDMDGDGRTWNVSKPKDRVPGNDSTISCVYSASWDKSPLTPDNYLVTPALKLPNGDYSLSWYVCGQDATAPNEYYEVHVGTMENGAFVSKGVIFSETVTAKGGAKAQGTWRQRTVSLADYAKQQVCIAFRHCNCTDAFYLDIDDVKVFNTTM